MFLDLFSLLESAATSGQETGSHKKHPERRDEQDSFATVSSKDFGEKRIRIKNKLGKWYRSFLGEHFPLETLLNKVKLFKSRIFYKHMKIKASNTFLCSSFTMVLNIQVDLLPTRPNIASVVRIQAVNKGKRFQKQKLLLWTRDLNGTMQSWILLLPLTGHICGARCSPVRAPLRLNKAAPYYSNWKCNTNADLLVSVYLGKQVYNCIAMH